MVEPIGHTGGVIDPPDEYLPILREICDRHNILLIFDEIITGIGRTGPDVRRRDVRRHARRALHRQGAERRLRPALGDDLPAADRRRLLGADRREPRLRRGAHLRGQPDLLRRRDRRAARDPRARPAAATPASRASACGPASRRWPRSTASSATSAARGCSRPIEFVRDRGHQGAVPAELAFGVRVGRRALENGLLCRFDPHWIAFGPPLVVHGRADRRDGGDPRPEPRRGAEQRDPRGRRAGGGRLEGLGFDLFKRIGRWPHGIGIVGGRRCRSRRGSRGAVLEPGDEPHELLDGLLVGLAAPSRRSPARPRPARRSRSSCWSTR